MSQPPPSRRLLLLDPDPSSALPAALRAALSDHELKVASPREDWAPLAEQAEFLVFATNPADLGSLRLLHHLLRRAPEKRAVLLVGDRGLGGAEPLLALPNVRFLPEPWTPRGLEIALASAAPAPAGGSAAEPAAATGEIMAGIVDGLRDPLASLSGYLQLLRGEASAEQSSLVGPALDSAREMDRLLEALELAARPGKARRESLDARSVAQRLVEEAIREGARAELDWQGRSITLDGDLKRLSAALYAARSFLDRFGPGGPLRLRGGLDEEGRPFLAWEAVQTPPAPTEAVAPPPFLPAILARLAEQLGADPVLRSLDEKVPLGAGLRWAPPEA
jgi:signal transduction histidine kinase